MDLKTEQKTRTAFPPAVMRTAEASRYLSLSPRTLARLTARGRLPFVRVGPRLRLFRRSELDAFLDRHTVHAGTS